MSEGEKKRGFMSWYFGSNLLMRILIGLILGIGAGFCLRTRYFGSNLSGIYSSGS